jgi:hypothetical protein
MEAGILDNLVGEKASNFLTTPLIPRLDNELEPSTGSDTLLGNFTNNVKRAIPFVGKGLYNNIISDSTSITGAAENYLTGKAIGAVGGALGRVFGRGSLEAGEGVIAKTAAKLAKEKAESAAAKAGLSVEELAAKKAAGEAKQKAQGILDRPQGLSRLIGELNHEFKALYLSSGVPGTNLSSHGVTLAARHALSTPLSEGGVFKGAAEVLPMLFSQKITRNKLASFSEKEIEHAMRSGAIVDPAAFGGGKKEILGKIPGYKKLIQLQGELFEKPLFDEFAPTLKMMKFQSEFKRGLKGGIDPKKVGSIAAENATNLFGGYKSGTGLINKMIWLAPDYYKTHFKTFQGMFKGVINPKDPQYSVYRHFAANLAAATTGLDLLNKHMSGKHIWENDPGYELSLNTGRKDSKGKDTYVNVLGGAADLPRLAFTTVNNALHKRNPLEDIDKFIVNRLSPIAQPLFRLVSNQDYKGQKYYGTKEFPTRVKVPGGKTFSIREQLPLSHTAGMVGKDIANIALPGYTQGALDYINGTISPDEAKARALELPLRFKKHYEGVQEVKRKRRVPIPITKEEKNRRQQLLKDYQ